MALVGLAVFWAIRLRNQPKQMGRGRGSSAPTSVRPT